MFSPMAGRNPSATARTFLAIPVETDQSLRLMEVMKAPGVRWIRPEQLHITLHFLGEISLQKVAFLDKLIRESLLPQAAFHLSFETWGTFPIKGASRILWVGLGGDMERLKVLWKKLGRIVESCSIAVEKHSYMPHVTLARSPNKKVISSEAVEKVSRGDFYGCSWKVQRFCLMKSTFFHGGVRHSLLEEYPLH